MDEEHRRLLGLIREATSESRAEPKDIVLISASEANIVPGSHTATVRISLKQSGGGTIENMHLAITTPDGITCSQEPMVIPRLSGAAGGPVVVEVSFGASGDCMPPTLSATATASYKSNTGEPRTSHCEMSLPLGLVAKVVAGSGDVPCKFTLDTDKEPVHVPTLYQEMAQEILLPDGSLPAANLISFVYQTGQEVKLIVSKSAGRYRITGSTIGAMCHVTFDLKKRLTKHYSGDLNFSFNESVPLPDYIQARRMNLSAHKPHRCTVSDESVPALQSVQQHHALRKSMAAHREVLADRAQQATY